MATVKIKTRYGATERDWDNLVTAGLMEDLLPVVSDPTRGISPNSTMKAVGKTPSVLNRVRDVQGIPRWTALKAGENDIARWRDEPAYGVCIQTRRLRAIDIDIDDIITAAAVREFVANAIDGKVPYRFRNGSGKCLIAVWVPSEEPIPKRVIQCGTPGMIEILGDGQQFVAAGTHTSGLRYEWSTLNTATPTEFPTLTVEEFNILVQDLQDNFGFGMLQTQLSSGKIVERHMPYQKLRDPLASWLADKGYVKSQTRDGRYNIVCPFEHEHTSDSGDSATQYFPAGLGTVEGEVFEQGHFKCLHAHCAGRKDEDFIHELRYGLDEFEDLTGIMPQEVVEPWDVIPTLRRNSKGVPYNEVDNVIAAVNCRKMVKAMVAYDSFRDQVVVAYDWSRGAPSWRPFRDTDYTTIRSNLATQAGFNNLGRGNAIDAIKAVAEMNTVDTLMVWANNLQWDGVSRVRGFVKRVWGGDGGDELAESISVYLWTALAGRAVSPGCKADTAVVLCGVQGAGKTRSVEAIAPMADMYREINLMSPEAEIRRQLRGAVAVELAELSGMAKRGSWVKAFLSGTSDNCRKLYSEFHEMIARRCFFFGTTNEPTFLEDDTGNRRFLPIQITKTKVDVDYVKKHRDQLWAEAIVLYRTGGVIWQNLSRDTELLTADRRIVPDMAESFDRWLRMEAEDGDGVLNGDKPFRMMHILDGIGITADRAASIRGISIRAGKALRFLGYEAKQATIKGESARWWVRMKRHKVEVPPVVVEPENDGLEDLL